jgi:peptide deformylase
MLVLEKDPILKQNCEEFDFSSDDAEKLAKQLSADMVNNEGIGLAAPQIGVLKRAFIIGDDSGILACFNPEIISYSEDEDWLTEGCLSYPGLYIKIKRPTTVDVRFQDLDGTVRDMKLEGIISRCYQHELDHLNGVTFQLKAGHLALQMAKKRRMKILKRHEQQKN